MKAKANGPLKDSNGEFLTFMRWLLTQDSALKERLKKQIDKKLGSD